MAKKRILGIAILLLVLLSTISFRVMADRPLVPAPQLTPFSGDEPAGTSAQPALSAFDPKWPDSLYYAVAGVTFRPRSSGTTWESSGNCLYAPSGSEFLNSALLLPEGSVIENLYLDYYNTSDASADLFLTRYNERGIQTDLISLHSTQNSGYASEESGYISMVVDNAAYSYAINFRPNLNSDEMRLCSVRIEYKTP